jgi:hypothetical protein
LIVNLKSLDSCYNSIISAINLNWTVKIGIVHGGNPVLWMWHEICNFVFRLDWQWLWWRVQLHRYIFATQKILYWFRDGMLIFSTRCPRHYITDFNTGVLDQGTIDSMMILYEKTPLFEKSHALLSFVVQLFIYPLCGSYL